jgi:predicted PurR-regulated permease PerM/methylmalonyl-CoA mutase cobalamin-binding subunit
MKTHRLMTLAAVVVIVAALYFAQAVLFPVAMAIFLSFVLSPLVARLERLRIGRVPSVMVVSALAFATIGSVGWLVGRQAMDIVVHLPEYRSNLQSKLEVVREKVERPLNQANDAVHQIANGGTEAPAMEAPATKAPAPASNAFDLGSLSNGLGRVLSALATAGIVALLVILMLLQRGELRDRFVALVGGSGLVVMTQALDEGSQRLGRYLLAATAINALHGAAIGIGLALIGVPNALLWGILSAVLRFVPYLGPGIAGLLPIVFSFAISDGFTTPLLVVALFLLLEFVSNNVVEPLVLPDQIGVSSTALVISAVFWTWLWGIPGLVLATPLTVCIAVLGKHVPPMRFLSVILGDKSVLSPSLRLYQRLLVDDVENAWNLVSAELDAKKPIVGIYDSVVLPALCLAQQDRQDGVIDPASLVAIAQHARELVDEVDERRKVEQTTPRRDAMQVVCVPAGSELEDVACAMLADALREAGIEPIVVSQASPVGEALDRIDAERVRAVCISQLPPIAHNRLRYVCNRIAARFPDLPLAVGTWTVTNDPERTLARLRCGARIKFASTLIGMQEFVRGIDVGAGQVATTESIEPGVPTSATPMAPSIAL